MASKKGYDVLRLIEHNQVCYVSSEYVEGSMLIQWLKYHPSIQKEDLFLWMWKIVKQLSQIHKCRGKPCYQYVNPYSIIVTDEEELYFLDMKAKSNEKQVRVMQRRAVRECFLPPEAPYYQKTCVGYDIYGLGRTLQYLLSESEPDPALCRSEIRKLQKIISRCLIIQSKKAFQNVSDIQKYIPKYRRQLKKKEQNKSKFAIGVLATVIGITTAITLYNASMQSVAKVEEKAGETNQDNSEWEESEADNSTKLKLELGLLYFLDKQDYEKSREYFCSIKKNVLAENLAVIAECMLGREAEKSDWKERLRKALEAAEEVMPQTDSLSYYRCFLQGYMTLELKKDMEQVLRIGKKCLDMESTEDKTEIQEYMAAAYEKIGQPEEAIRLYEEQMLGEIEEEEREEIYKKLATLLERCGQADRAQEKMREGIARFPKSAELRILYIRMQCQNLAIDRGICMQTIESFIKEFPELNEEVEFQKLMKEYGWKVEGEKVWAEEPDI